MNGQIFGCKAFIAGQRNFSYASTRFSLFAQKLSRFWYENYSEMSPKLCKNFH